MSTTQPEALRLADALASNYFDGKQGREVWDSAAAELRRLHAKNSSLKVAFDEWIAKTEWVQKSLKPRELGKHRADILHARIADLEAQLASIGGVSPPEGMAGWKPIADAPEDEPVLLWSEIKGGAPILDAWGRYMQYNQPQFTHFMLVRPPLASEAKEAGHADQA